MPKTFKFLCLPGTFGSIKNYKVQLSPFTDELELDGACSFTFTQGEFACVPPEGYEKYFGPPPHYRFINYAGIENNDVILRIRDFPETATAEDTLRELLPDGQKTIDDVVESTRICYEALFRMIKEQGPFDGILGYSEGATIAASLILEEKRRLLEEGIPRNIKCGIFFAGWPPMKDTGGPYLFDTDGEVIDIPTVNVIGCQDPYIDGAMALFNVCNQDEARLFDTGKGHTLPRDPQTLRELGDVIKEMCANLEEP